jgi:hypothetical protein
MCQTDEQRRRKITGAPTRDTNGSEGRAKRIDVLCPGENSVLDVSAVSVDTSANEEVETANDWSDRPIGSTRLKGGFYHIRQEWNWFSERALGLDDVYCRRFADECLSPLLATLRDPARQKRSSRD